MSCLLAVCLAVGITANSYENIEDTYALNLKVGNDVYAWAGYEPKFTTRILGQGLSDAALYSVGIGAKYKHERWFGFIEAGYAVTDATDKPVIRNEIVYTHLVNNHGVRPVPSRDPGKWANAGVAHTSYDLGDAALGRVGIGYQYEALQVSIAYRFLNVDEHMRLWDDDVVAATGGWWQETNTRQLSAFEVGVAWEF